MMLHHTLDWCDQARAHKKRLWSNEDEVFRWPKIVPCVKAAGMRDPGG